MKKLWRSLLLTLSSTSLQADSVPGTLIFHDDFNRSESQELKDEPGNGWTTSSNTTAGGHKQVDLREGHLYIYTHESAWHATSVRHTFEFKDGSLGIRFMFDRPDDELILNFTDLSEKSVHAGHLFNVTISPKELDIRDLKTGVMNLEIMKLRRAKQLPQEKEQQLEREKRKRSPLALELKTWHDVRVDVKGDLVSVYIDGQFISSHRSEGYSHPQKAMIRLLARKDVHVDDIRVWRVN